MFNRQCLPANVYRQCVAANVYPQGRTSALGLAANVYPPGQAANVGAGPFPTFRRLPVAFVPARWPPRATLRANAKPPVWAASVGAGPFPTFRRLPVAFVPARWPVRASLYLKNNTNNTNNSSTYKPHKDNILGASAHPQQRIGGSPFLWHRFYTVLHGFLWHRFYTVLHRFCGIGSTRFYTVFVASVLHGFTRFCVRCQVMPPM